MVDSWDESLETGNAVIDSQHRQLIHLVDALKEPHTDNIFSILNEVMDFTNIHFLSEEELMDEVNYPPDAAREMIYQHMDFKAYARLRILEFRHTRPFDIMPFQSFTENFLKVHEFGRDRQLADWIKQQGETSRAA